MPSLSKKRTTGKKTTIENRIIHKQIIIQKRFPIDSQQTKILRKMMMFSRLFVIVVLAFLALVNAQETPVEAPVEAPVAAPVKAPAFAPTRRRFPMFFKRSPNASPRAIGPKSPNASPRAQIMGMQLRD
jgi:hypothetical protein